ncbi:MAG: hypothetical protein M0C28_37725 [Candidatus Moduliflexus flocculans]|nr:hypothetical protein [Candidatus Moduliflexus flocculans]
MLFVARVHGDREEVPVRQVRHDHRRQQERGLLLRHQRGADRVLELRHRRRPGFLLRDPDGLAPGGRGSAHRRRLRVRRHPGHPPGRHEPRGRQGLGHRDPDRRPDRGRARQRPGHDEHPDLLAEHPEGRDLRPGHRGQREGPEERRKRKTAGRLEPGPDRGSPPERRRCAVPGASVQAAGAGEPHPCLFWRAAMRPKAPEPESPS